jgi:hypothetical protein
VRSSLGTTLLIVLASPTWATAADHSASSTPPLSPLHVKMTVQESIYEGIGGFSRQQEPLSVGIPLADSAGVRDAAQLGLDGASEGQFRVLGRWPSGNIEWVLVDTLVDLAAGKTNSSISLTNGSGNFGGADLATQDPSNITVSTGSARFVVRKKKFDLIDEASVDGHALVKPGASPGLVILGPAPGHTACPCPTAYSSSNDEGSDAVIEENGPVRAVVRATGQLKDDAGHAYMRYTVRLHFYKGKTRVKTVVILQNADYGPSDSFASSYKGFRSFEARLAPNLNSGRVFRFGAPHSIESAAFTDNDDAYLYQAYSDKMEHPQWSSPDVRSHFAPRSYIKRTIVDQSGSHRKWSYGQEGCQALHGEKTLATGGRSEYCAGWADLSDATGRGIEIGVYQMAAYWPKLLQFVKGGSEIRVGIWPDQSLFGTGAQDYYQAWPQYSIQTVYFNFRDHASPDPAEEFGRSQFPLIARASVSYYNQTKAFLYPLVDPDREDEYFHSLGLACCAKDISLPHVYRTYGWRAAGSGNQAEMRWANLMLWLQRGYAGRYVDASHFYTFQAEQVFPRSDYNEGAPFNWRDRPESELDPTGLPDGITSLNDNAGCDPGEMKCGRNWIDNAHAHWYGMIDYYFMSGDETIKDAIQDGVSDIYGNPGVKVVKNGTYWNPRNVGEALMSDARLALFYRATGDHQNEDRALLAGTQVLNKQVWPELRVSGFGTASQGVSRTRGVHFGCCPQVQRFAMPFQEGILSEGLWEFLQAEGPDWPQRQLTFDLAYGVGSWALNEAWRTNATGKGCRSGSGMAYEIFIDQSNNPLEPSCVHTGWFNFYNYAKYTGDTKLWAGKFEQYLQHINGNGVFYGEIGTIFEGAVVGEVLNPEPVKLVSVPLQVEKQSSGTYRLTWTVPIGAHSYRLKYSDKNIVEWLDFDAVTNRFLKDPAANAPWFAASDASGVPAPAAAKSTQSYEVGALDSKTQWHFALKAYVENGP